MKLEFYPIISYIKTYNQNKIAPPGKYNPQIRTITWFTGEVGSGEGGYAEFSANVRGDAPDGTENINYGIVYFPIVIRGDLDRDRDVDINDLNILLTYRNQPASACPRCDIDGDGMITVLDARKLVLLCTRPRCATK